VEKSRVCIKLCKQMYPDKCIFADILGMLDQPPTATDEWLPAKLKLRETCHCVQHKQKYGKREGLSNLAIKKVHDTATAFQMRTDMSVHENVPDYEDDYLDKHLKGHTRQRVLLCPRRFGHPNGRLRSWRITFNTQKKHWSCTWSLEELADAILAPLGTASKLTYDVYFAMPEVAFEHDTARLAEHTLSRCQKQHLEQFRTDIPLCSLYDLSANCRKRRRTENTDLAMPCLTTSSQLWLPGSNGRVTHSDCQILRTAVSDVQVRQEEKADDREGTIGSAHLPIYSCSCGISKGFGPVCSASAGSALLAVFGSAATGAAAADAVSALCLPGGGAGGGAAGGGPGHFGGSFGSAFGGVTGTADSGAPLEVVAMTLGAGSLGRALRSIFGRSCEKRDKLKHEFFQALPSKKRDKAQAWS
ncbi:unnamed protein product, partial [Effrenium voratum]